MSAYKLLILKRETGIEPATSSLGSWHSTAELLPLSGMSLHQLVLGGYEGFRGGPISDGGPTMPAFGHQWAVVHGYFCCIYRNCTNSFTVTTMNIEGTNALKESGHEDIRELLARSKAANQGERGSVRAFLSSVRLSTAIDLLETSAVSLSAVCLCILLAGVSLFFIQRYYVQARISADAAASALESPGSFAEVGGEAETNGLPNSLIQYGPSGATDAFTIRVGAFRDPSNARRVAESLEQNSLAVKTDVRADGLHVLTLGPFSGKGAAEDAARHVQETVGLVPLVVRSNFR